MIISLKCLIIQHLFVITPTLSKCAYRFLLLDYVCNISN
ncbi:hypothetical protein PSPO_a2521 [Pseudoalteromonas spongiae UST010723-006]|nr:hypothetical protein PSPO_a2521 [Pseudoalteromonas spongiae UST010723-006]